MWKEGRFEAGVGVVSLLASKRLSRNGRWVVFGMEGNLQILCKLLGHVLSSSSFGYCKK